MSFLPILALDEDHRSSQNFEPLLSNYVQFW